MVVTQGFFMLFDSGIIVCAGVEAGGLCFGDAASLDFYQMCLGAAATPEFLLFCALAGLD